jgi:hypothetical protein
METAPAWQCPNCHIAYNKFGSPFSREAIKKTDGPSGIKWWLSFPRFFVFQPIGIMPPISSHAEH